MGLSGKMVMDMLEEEKTLKKSDIGFITTVFRDNASDDKMHRYYSVVLELLLERGKIMAEEENQLVRLNVRVSKENNDYLERKSAQTGISKSALVQIAVEQYRQQNEAVQAMNNMQKYVDQMEMIKDEVASLKSRI